MTQLLLLDVQGVTMTYPDVSRSPSSQPTVRPRAAVEQVSFGVSTGERCVLLGASGSGKSTLLKAIGGYIEPSAGTIMLAGQRIRGPGPDRIMMFQEFDQLLPWKTVLGNVTFALEVSGKARGAAARTLAQEAIAKVKLERVTNSYPHQLFGGMKQRVALARALAMEPQILLMDEPFAALDAQTRAQMQDELMQLWESLRFTLVFVTHSIREALIIGSRILILTPHPGRLRADLVGSPGKEALIHELLFDAVAPAAPGIRKIHDD